MVNHGTMWKCSHWPETGTMTPCLLLCQSRYLYRSQQGEWATIVGECVPKDVQRHQTPEAPLIKILINPSHVLFLILQTVCWGLASVLGFRAMSQGSIVLLTLACDADSVSSNRTIHRPESYQSWRGELGRNNRYGHEIFKFCAMPLAIYLFYWYNICNKKKKISGSESFTRWLGCESLWVQKVQTN